MSRANTIQTNFTAGELSPFVYGRVDVTKYFNGARTLKNVISLPQGGLIRRPGTYYIGEVLNSAQNAVVRKFVFSGSDSYVLEFGHQNVKIWQSGVAVTTVVTPYGQNDIGQLKFAQSADVVWITHPSYYPRTLTRVSSSVWTLALYANTDGPYMATEPEPSLQLTNVSDLATATCVSSIFSTTGSTKNVTNVTRHATYGNCVITINSHGYSTGDSILIRNVVGVPEANGAYVIESLTANTFRLMGSVFSGSSLYVSGGTAIVCSGTHVEFRDNNEWKVARIMDITSGTVATVDVSDAVYERTAKNVLTQYPLATAGTAKVQSEHSEVFGYEDRYSYVRCDKADTTTNPVGWVLLTTYISSSEMHGVKIAVLNYDNLSKEVTISGRAITATMTVSAATFDADDVGRMVRINFGDEWIPGTITSYTSSTVVGVTLTREVPVDVGAQYKNYNDGRTTRWKIGAWSTNTGYPTTVAFHQQRITFTSTAVEPSTVWMSQSADFYSFEPSDPENSAVNDDHAITFVIASSQVNVVRWMISGPVLLIGTEGSEWQVKPSSIAQTITPTNISVTEQTAYGSMNLAAFKVGSRTLFVERNKLKVRELQYDFTVDNFVSQDLTILSEHLLRNNAGVVDWAVMSNPYSIAWVVTTNGKLLSMTYEKDQEVIAWNQHDVGGLVKSCCVIPSASGEDELYLVVQRTVNGSTKKFIERISGFLNQNVAYVDCHRYTNYSDVGIDTWNGMSHLNGESVDVSLDGVYLDRQTVASGIVHIGYVGDLVQAGLPMEAVVGILDPEGGSPSGTSQGKKKRVSESTLRVVNSYYFKVASANTVTNDTENLTAGTDPQVGDRRKIVPDYTLAARTTVGTPGTNYPLSTFALFTGDVSFYPDDAFDCGGRFEIVQDLPFPLTVVALMHKLNTNE